HVRKWLPFPLCPTNNAVPMCNSVGLRPACCFGVLPHDVRIFPAVLRIDVDGSARSPTSLLQNPMRRQALLKRVHRIMHQVSFFVRNKTKSLHHLPFESTTPVAIPFTITRSMSALQESQGVFASTMIPSSSTTKPDAFHGSWNAAAAHCHTVFAEKSKPPNTSVASSHQMNPRACGSSSWQMVYAPTGTNPPKMIPMVVPSLAPRVKAKRICPTTPTRREVCRRFGRSFRGGCVFLTG